MSTARRACIEFVGVVATLLLVQLVVERDLTVRSALISVAVGLLAIVIDPLWGAWRRKRQR
ncbi:hypothetical protein [Streptomyces violascens]|uniref:hypothetical protein n=1 Tax=Streptomyces violascens TaxID=67381 RepID=UPI0036693BB3